MDASEVAAGAELLFLAIPMGKVTGLSRKLFASLPHGAVVIECGNYVPPRDGRIAEIDAGSPEASWTAKHLGLSIVKAFNNITHDSLEHGGNPKSRKNRIALPISGDHLADRARVMRLVEELGFDAFDAGSLAESWRQQIGQPAYCTDPTLAQLPGLLARADRSSVARKREDAMRMMTRMPSDFPKPDLVRAARFMAGIGRGKPATWVSLARLGWAMAQPKPKS